VPSRGGSTSQPGRSPNARLRRHHESHAALSGHRLSANRRAISVACLAIAASLGAIAGVTWLLEHTSSHVGEALTAAATVALVLLTAVYVRLTGRLVRAQEQPLTAIRVAAQETLVRQITVKLWTAGLRIRTAASRFPVIASGPPKTDALEQLETEMLEVASELSAVSAQFPKALHDPALRVAIAMNQGCTDILALVATLRSEQETADLEGRPFDWSQARAVYYTHLRDVTADKLEWDALLEGARVTSSCEALGEFEFSLRSYLQG
jgi:hypothetical protein